MPFNFKKALDNYLKPQTSLTSYIIFKNLDLDRTIRAFILIKITSAIFSIAVIINTMFINQNIFNHLATTPVIKIIY